VCRQGDWVGNLWGEINHVLHNEGVMSLAHMSRVPYTI